MVTHLNTKFLFILAFVIALIGVGTYFLHDYQVDRQSFVLKDNAEKSYADGDSETAIRLLSQYVQLAPDDLAALKQLGDWIDQSPPTASSIRRAYTVYSELLRESPNRPDAHQIRFRLAQLMIRLGEFSQAETQLSKLLQLHEAKTKTKPDSAEDTSPPVDRAEALHLMGQSQAAQDQQYAALASTLAAVLENPRAAEYFSSAINLVASLSDELPDRTLMANLLVEIPPKPPSNPKDFTALQELEENFLDDLAELRNGGFQEDLKGTIASLKEDFLIEPTSPDENGHYFRSVDKTPKDNRDALPKWAEIRLHFFGKLSVDGSAMLACLPFEPLPDDSVKGVTSSAGGGRTANANTSKPQAPLESDSNRQNPADDALIKYLLARMIDTGIEPEFRVQPEFEGRIARAEYYLSQGEFDLVDVELSNVPEEDRNQPEVALFESNYALSQADRRAQEEKREEALKSIALAEKIAQAGKQQDTSELRYDLVLANASHRRFQIESDPEAQTSALEEALKLIHSAVERLPEIREAHLKLEDLEQRDEKFELLNVLEVELRSQLIQTACTLLESNLFTADRVKEDLKPLKSLLPETVDPQTPSDIIAALIYALEDLTRENGLLVFLRTRNQYSELQRQILTGQVDIESGSVSWGALADALRMAQLEVIGRQAFRRQVDMMLNRCYQELNDDPARVTLFEDALERDTSWRQGRLELARAFRDAGRIAEAIREYSNLIRQFNFAPAVPELILVQVQNQQSLSSAQRQWDHIDSQIKQLRALNPSVPELRLLDAEVKAQQGAFDEADQLLQDAFTLPDLTREQKTKLWQSRIRLQLNRSGLPENEKLESARKLWNSAKLDLGDSAEVDLMWLMIAENESDKVLAAEARKLYRSLGKYAGDQRNLVLESLAAVYKNLSQPDKVYEIRKELAEQHPESLRHHLQLCYAALRNDVSTFDDHLAVVRRIEGEDGPEGNLVEAMWHIRKYNQETSSKESLDKERHFKSARELLDRVERKRPQLAIVPVLQGDLAGQNNEDELKQFERYRKAFDLGATQPHVLEFLSAYLKQNNRSPEFIEVSERIRQEHPNSFTSAMQSRLTDAYQAQDRVSDEARTLRTPAVDAEPFLQELNQGHASLAEYEVLEFENPNSEDLEKLFQGAETHYRNATEAAPEDPRVWMGLVTFYVKTGRNQQAHAAVQQAQQLMPDEPPELKPLTLADCYEALGELDEAMKQIERAIELAPEATKTHVRMVKYAARVGDQTLERKHLQKIIGLARQEGLDLLSSQAEDRLTHLKALESATYVDAARAIQQLEESLPEEPAARFNNLVTQYRILTRFQIHDFQLKMAHVLEQIEQTGFQPLSVTDRLMEIALYKTRRQFDVATEKLAGLIAEYPDDIIIRAYATGYYIDQEDLSIAQEQLNALEDRMPDGFIIATLQAKLEFAKDNASSANKIIQQYLADLSETESAETVFYDSICRHSLSSAFNWLADLESAQDLTSRKRLSYAKQRLRDGNIDSARRMVTPLLERNDVQKRYLAYCHRDAATLLERFRLLAEAEQVYRRYMQMTDDENAPAQLVALIGQQGRVDDAIEEGEKSLNQKNAAMVVTNLEAVLRTQRVSAAQRDRVMAVLDRAIDADPENVFLLLQLADYQDFIQDYDAAERTYLRILRKYPNHPMALNNLAWLFAVRETNPQRIRNAGMMIDQAINVYGPSAELLDTKATVEMSAGHFEEAIGLLKKSISSVPKAKKYYRLSLAQVQAGQREAARESYQKALSDGFDPSKLHPLEQHTFEELQGAFAFRN